MTNYPDSPRTPEARYWLGETLFVREAYGDAAGAYIGAIRGWPQTAWAPEAVVELSRSLIALVDAGRPDARLSSIAKVQATEMAQKVTLQCQQMFGGYGYFGALPLERMVRDVRMLTITGGTTQTQKNLIASHIFGTQGAGA